MRIHPSDVHMIIISTLALTHRMSVDDLCVKIQVGRWANIICSDTDILTLPVVEN